VASSLTSANGLGSSQETVLPSNSAWRSRVRPTASACSGRLSAGVRGVRAGAGPDPGGRGQ